VTFVARIAHDRPDEIALRDRDNALTWSQVDERLRSATTALQNTDLGPARRVAILAKNSADTLLAYVACTLAGTSAGAVNSHLTATETAYILSDSQASLILCDTDSATVAAHAAQVAKVATVVAWGEGDLPAGVTRWSD
jgi:long-chain acyl-CoA synthetase